jgi:hypothetical protein
MIRALYRHECYNVVRASVLAGRLKIRPRIIGATDN